MPTESKSLEDIFDEYMTATDRPDQKSLARFVARYPARAEELTELTADWVILAAIDDNPSLEAESNDDAVSQAVSDFHNRLFELDQTESTESTALLFDGWEAQQLRNAARSLKVRGPFMVKIRCRLVIPSTIPERFVTALAKVLSASPNQVEQYLRLQPQMPAVNFKADGKPTPPGQQSFRDAMLGCGMSEDECSAWTTEKGSAGDGR